MSELKIPTPVIGVVGDVLGCHYYSHTRLNTLFMEHGAPGESPQGNCVTKCTEWLKRCNADAQVDALLVLGGVIEDFMEFEIGNHGPDDWKRDRDRVTKVLTKNGLSYLPGGRIVASGTAPSAMSIREILRSKDLGGVEAEFRRALDSVASDPPAAVTAACALLESLCKAYIEDEGFSMPPKQTLKPLWKAVSDHLGFDPAQLADDDLKRILSGLTSLVDGIASLRTHAGSAHGRGRKAYRIEPRHARLAINGAHALALFVLETWEKQGSADLTRQ